MSLNPLDGRTPLHLAAENGNTAGVKSLLDAGADPNAPDKNKFTPLHIAAWRGHTDTIKVLLEGGADPNARNKYDWTPLHSASQNGCVDTIDGQKLPLILLPRTDMGHFLSKRLLRLNALSIIACVEHKQ